MRSFFCGLVLILIANSLTAQVASGGLSPGGVTNPATAANVPPSGSISGRIVYSPTGEPVPDAVVSVRSSGTRVQAKTDGEGRYVLKGVAPGLLTLNASKERSQGFPLQASRRVQLSQTQDLISVEIKLAIPPQIKGRVLDENREPVPYMQVLLVTREYSHGALRYTFTNATMTDDRGDYTISPFGDGRTFLLMVRPRPTQTDPVSDLPTNPALRKRRPAPTFYPGATSVEGAQVLTLGDGEIREGVDIPVVRAPSLCIEGRTFAGSAPAALNFDISTETPAFGVSDNGGMFGTGMISGKTGQNGVIRACGLTPGTWAIHVDQPGQTFRDTALFFGTAVVTLHESDLHDVAIAASPRITLPVEVTLDGPAPVSTPDHPNPIPDLTVLLTSLVYAQHSGDSGENKVSVPGSLLLEGLLADRYSVTVRGLGKGMYVESATYNNEDVLRHVLRAGTAADRTALRIVIGQNGGSIQAAVTDKDNNPASDCFVTVFPADTMTEADIAATYTTGVTDQTGAWKSGTLAPGSYYVIATPAATDHSPEAVGRLLRGRLRADPVIVPAGGSVNAPVVERVLQ